MPKKKTTKEDQAITVGELIEQLSKLPPDSAVVSMTRKRGDPDHWFDFGHLSGAVEDNHDKLVWLDIIQAG